MIELYANSHRIGKRIPGTQHAALNEQDAAAILDKVRAYPESEHWPRMSNGYSTFYYPADLGAYLHKVGVDTKIHAHSGAVYINGERE